MVNVNFRPSQDGKRKTAYLTYTADGTRHRINTRITIPTTPKTPLEKLQVKEALRAVEAERVKMELRLLEGKTGHVTSAKRAADFAKVLNTLLDEDKTRLAEGTTHYRAIVVSYWEKAFPNGVRVDAVGNGNIQAFVDWVKTNTRSGNRTIAQYLTILGGYMKRARRAGYPVPTLEILKPTFAEKKRTYLTPKELAQFKLYFKPQIGRDLNPEDILEVRRMFLFSCYTGLRHCDMIAARYSDIERLKGGHFILRIRQQKTGAVVAVPLIDKALQYLDADKFGNDFPIFKPIPVTRCDGFLKRHQPIKGKPISMHIARHTFAVSLLENGADIYAVSRLLGHKNVKTTQIYADATAVKLRTTIELLNDSTNQNQ